MKKTVLLPSFVLLATAFLGANQLYAQGTVSTEGKKYVLVEEGTGAWCQYCADGAVKLEAVLKNNPRTLGASVHNGSSTSDKMAFPDGEIINTTYQDGFPYGNVDRVPYNGTIGMNRGYWDAAVKARLSAPPQFDIEMSHVYNKTKNEITITITAKALQASSGKYNVNVYITEDSVSGTGKGWDQVNSSDKTPGHPYYGAGNPIKGFQHMKVLRATLGGPFGTKGVIKDNPKTGDSATKTYVYPIPTGYKLEHLNIIGLVQVEHSDPEKAPIVNSIAASLDVTTGVESVTSSNSFTLYPNPATERINFTAALGAATETTVTITNAIGQVVYQNQYSPSGQVLEDHISLENFHSGMYLFTLEANGEQVTKRFIVNK